MFDLPPGIDCGLHIPLYTHHAKAVAYNPTLGAVPLSNVTPGVGIGCRKDDLLGVVGIVKQSVGKTGLYAMVGWQPLKLVVSDVAVRAGIYGGVITNYPKTLCPKLPLDACPTGGFVMSFGYKDGEVHVTYSPSFEYKGAKVIRMIGLSYLHRF